MPIAISLIISSTHRLHNPGLNHQHPPGHGLSSVHPQIIHVCIFSIAIFNYPSLIFYSPSTSIKPSMFTFSTRQHLCSVSQLVCFSSDLCASLYRAGRPFHIGLTGVSIRSISLFVFIPPLVILIRGLFFSPHPQPLYRQGKKYRIAKAQAQYAGLQMDPE